MSQLRDTEDDLRAHWSNLQTQWLATRQTWRDGVAERFEREFWDDCEQTMRQFFKCLDDLATTFAQTERNLD